MLTLYFILKCAYTAIKKCACTAHFQPRSQALPCIFWFNLKRTLRIYQCCVITTSERAGSILISDMVDFCSIMYSEKNCIEQLFIVVQHFLGQAISLLCLPRASARQHPILNVSRVMYSRQLDLFFRAASRLLKVCCKVRVRFNKIFFRRATQRCVFEVFYPKFSVHKVIIIYL